MLATIAIVIAQNAQEPPDEGTGIGLILVGVLIAAAVAIGILLVFTRLSKRSTTGAPDHETHTTGHVGISDLPESASTPTEPRTGARLDPSRRGVEQSGSSSGS